MTKLRMHPSEPVMFDVIKFVDKYINNDHFDTIHNLNRATVQTSNE